MKFSEFLKKLTKEQVNIWWDSIAPENAPKNIEENNWKYKLAKNNKSLPFKWAIDELAKYYNIDFSKKDFDSNVSNRDTFSDAFDFEIEEDLVYDTSEFSSFKKFYLKFTITHHQLFQHFNNYIHQLLIDNQVNPYKIRMALRDSDKEAMVIIGMRATQSFRINNGKAFLAFIVKDSVLNIIPENKIISKEQFTGKDTNKWLIRFEVEKWDDIPTSILESNTQCFSEEYNSIKNTKRATWNSEANSTNSALKYVSFKDKNIEQFINENIENSSEDFKSIIKEVQIYINKNDSILKGFKYSKLQKRFAWFSDNKNIIGDLAAHYEFELRNKRISIDIHFEDENSKLFQKELEAVTFPSKIKWLDRKHKDGRKEITYYDMYDINSPNLIGQLYNALEYLELNLGDKIRDIKNKIHLKENNPSSENNMKKFPLNQILYGPPGTGKTYNTINKALEIINEDEVKQLDFNDRKAVKDLFDKKLKDGQIMFTTFHQSMSYEDFIEGIKPEIEEDEEGRKSVIYEVKKGIFKQIAEEARKIRYQSEELSQQYTFDDAWDDLVSEAYEYLEKEESLILNIQTVGMGLKVVDISEKGNLKVQPKSSKEAKIYTVSFSRAKKLQEAFPDLSVIKNIDKEFRAVIGGSNSTAYWAVLNYINQKINSESTIIQQEIPLAPKPYVLIIDEINRGNVSQIFGELITLIEEDKRLGKNEALEVILPYSKEKFGVPSNLHIIGTMNTADRSVEALDTALRRRFSFVEMMPEYEELNKIQFDDFHLGELLKTINSRIEALLDRDHTIGHSYFINIKPNDTEALKEAFANKIIPLLQEYFYHDYEKIALILGEGFVECIEPKESKVEFARWNGKTLEKPETSRLFKIKKLDDNFNILDSIKHLLNRVAI